MPLDSSDLLGPLQVSPDLLQPLNLGAGVAEKKSSVLNPFSDPLSIIEHYESDNRNVPGPLFSLGAGHTPSGYWQIANSTWNRYASNVGAPKLEWPTTAMDQPREVQQAVAQEIYNHEGWGPWANYNPRLAAAIGYKLGGRAMPQGQFPSIHGEMQPAMQPLQNRLFDPSLSAPIQQEAATPPTATQTVPPMQGARGTNPMLALTILQAIMGKTHQFTPIEYDPFAVASAGRTR